MDDLVANKAKAAGVKKQRSCWLSAFLILMLIANALTAYIYTTNPELVMGLYPRATATVLYLLAVIACINVILAIGIWAWRKWGVIGFYISIIIVFIINLYLGVGFLASMPGLVGGAIIFFTTKKRWQHFS
ncbi:MAG: hypothetical protein ACI80S_000648 [Pseudohongiellaceae bacterium]|jgi:hypothetical protein